MSWLDEVEHWPKPVLLDLGYDRRSAKRLHRLLPPVRPGLIASGWNTPLHARQGGDHPAAAIVWVIHELNGRESVRLARSGRDVLDLIALLDAVVAVHPARPRTPTKADLAAPWAEATDLPTARAVRYIDAGITLREALDFEANPVTRPSDDQLGFLAALRTPGEPS